jgi:hypothetical protein
MSDQRRGSRLLIITVAWAFLLKLWLTSETRIIAAYAPHDGSNFLEHAKSIAMGYWFGPYDQMTLIKQPFFPIYMAALQEFGIPLPIGHLLIYGLACFVACFAIKPLVRSPFLLSAMFVVLYFNPMEYNANSWLTIRGQINPTLALLTISCAIGMFVRRRESLSVQLRWSVALGASFVAFWLTREEAIWIVPALAVLLIAYFCAPLRERSWSGFRPRLAAAGVSAILWALGVGTIMLINGTLYGWYTTGENTSPELVSAYNSLARIDPLVPTDPRFPVPHAARAIAYRISPAARELAFSLEGAEGNTWAGYGCLIFHACGDIHGGWFIWAFRDAVSQAGYYSSGAKAREFYVRLANQIDAACAARTIACKPKAHTLAPPLAVADVPRLAGNVAAGVRIGTTFEQFTISPAHYVGPASLRPDYDFIVRSVDDGFPIEPAGKTDDLKRAVLVEIAHTYQVVFPYWVLLALLTVLVRMVLLRWHSRPGEVDLLVIVASLLTGFMSLDLVLSLVETLSFPALNPEYTSPLFPLMIMGVTLVTAIAAPEVVRFIEARLPPPEMQRQC